MWSSPSRSEEHTSELQSQSNLVCRLLLEKKKKLTSTQRQDPRPFTTLKEASYKLVRVLLTHISIASCSSDNANTIRDVIATQRSLNDIARRLNQPVSDHFMPYIHDNDVY